MSVDILLDRLEKVRKNGRNQWMACCPSHSDKSPSLSISEPSPDHILLKCFAGCEVPDILISVGLSMTDLFPETNQHSFIKSQPYHERAKIKQVERENSELLSMKATLLFYEQAIKAGQKFSREDNEKYLGMFQKIKTFTSVA